MPPAQHRWRTRVARHRRTPRSESPKAKRGAPISTRSGSRWPPRLLFLCTHAHPAPHLQGRRGRMKPSPGRKAPGWKHPSPASSSRAAPAPPLGARSSPDATATFSPPSSQAVPRGTFLATPARLPSRPGERPPGGAREGRERPREARPPASSLRAPNTKRPARATCSHPARGAGGTSWWRPHFSPQPSLPCLGLPCCLGRCPGKPRRAAAAKAKAGCGAREERRVARGHSPGRPGAARVLPGRCRRPTVGASARDELGGGGSARRLRGGADPARPPGVGSAWLSRSGSGAAPRLLAAFRAEGCRQAANGDPAGGLATRPTHLRAARPGRRCSCCAALAAPPRSALWARWRALPRTPPHQPTHPTPAQRAVARNVGAPPVTSGYAALFR